MPQGRWCPSLSQYTWLRVWQPELQRWCLSEMGWQHGQKEGQTQNPSLLVLSGCCSCCDSGGQGQLQGAAQGGMADPLAECQCGKQWDGQETSPLPCCWAQPDRSQVRSGRWGAASRGPTPLIKLLKRPVQLVSQRTAPANAQML